MVTSDRCVLVKVALCCEGDRTTVFSVLNYDASMHEPAGVILYKHGGWAEQIYVHSPWDNKSIPACTRKHRMTQLIHLGRIMTAGLGKSLGEGEMVLMNDFQSTAATANSLPVPKGLMAPICRSGRNEWKALCKINGLFLFDIYKRFFLVKLDVDASVLCWSSNIKKGVIMMI